MNERLEAASMGEERHYTRSDFEVKDEYQGVAVAAELWLSTARAALAAMKRHQSSRKDQRDFEHETTLARKFLGRELTKTCLSVDTTPLDGFYEQVTAWQVKSPAADPGIALARLRLAADLLGRLLDELTPYAQGTHRLRAIVDASPHFLLDGEMIQAEEVVVRYVCALIDANGVPVAFAQWRSKHPEFEGAIVTRVLKKLPPKIAKFVERGGKGKPPRIKIELLRAQ
jgi:hypothetical protein